MLYQVFSAFFLNSMFIKNCGTTVVGFIKLIDLLLQLLREGCLQDVYRQDLLALQVV